MNLLSTEEVYRGISRKLGLPPLSFFSREWSGYFVIFNKYLEWLSVGHNSYCEESYHLLVALMNENIKYNLPCEIIFFSDKPEEFHMGKGFLGFDAYWEEEGISGIEKGCQLADEYFLKKLNKNGLFPSFEDAQEFCIMWKEYINTHDLNTWILEQQPKPFCVWLPCPHQKPRSK